MTQENLFLYLIAHGKTNMLRLLVKLKRAPNIDVAKTLAFKEFGALTKQRKIREQSIGTEDDMSDMQP